MADDARISTAIRNHPKTRKLKKRLGNDAVLSLIWLFLYAAESRPNGDLQGMTGEDIELAADWEGAESGFVAALSDVGFLDGESGSYKIHDWAEHNPWAASRPRRQEAAREAASQKWLKRGQDQTRSQRLSGARALGTHLAAEWQALLDICGCKCLRCLSADDLVKDHIVPIYQGGSDAIENLQPLCRKCNSSKGPDDTDLRPSDWAERLRVAVTSQAISSSDACKMPAHHTTPPLPTTSNKPKTYCAEPDGSPQPIVGTLPLNDNSEYPIAKSDEEQWKVLYPAVDVRQELRNMKGWLMGNPTRRKTKSGIKKFIHNWLAKAQNEAKAPNGTNQPAGPRSLGKQSDRNEANRDAILAGIFGPNAGRDAAPGSGAGENHGDPGRVIDVGAPGSGVLS